MLSSYLLVLTLASASSLVSAGIFPQDSLVKMVDTKGFRKALKSNQTSVFAFIAPWCGHCQRMAPELSKAALGLYPLVPIYGVNCDDDKNKRLCAEQDVKGFPTIKLFPRGKTLPPITYDKPERSASNFFYWATRAIPNTITKVHQIEDIDPWVNEGAKSGRPRALLLRKEKKVPLLWSVLGNKYKDQIDLAAHRDRKGKSSVALGYEAGDPKHSKVLIYPAGSTQAVVYEGLNKFDSLSKFFDAILDGTADLKIVNQEAAEEEFNPTAEELDIEKKQEAQRIALVHGGFADMVDFQKAIMDGAAANYHDAHGFPGMMGGIPEKKKKKADASGATEPPHTPADSEHPTANTPIETASQTDHPETMATASVVGNQEHTQVVFQAAEASSSPSVEQCDTSNTGGAAEGCKYNGWIGDEL